MLKAPAFKRVVHDADNVCLLYANHCCKTEGDTLTVRPHRITGRPSIAMSSKTLIQPKLNACATLTSTTIVAPYLVVSLASSISHSTNLVPLNPYMSTTLTTISDMYYELSIVIFFLIVSKNASLGTYVLFMRETISHHLGRHKTLYLILTRCSGVEKFVHETV